MRSANKPSQRRTESPSAFDRRCRATMPPIRSTCSRPSACRPGSGSAARRRLPLLCGRSVVEDRPRFAHCPRPGGIPNVPNQRHCARVAFALSKHVVAPEPPCGAETPAVSAPSSITCGGCTQDDAARSRHLTHYREVDWSYTWRSAPTRAAPNRRTSRLSLRAVADVCRFLATAVRMEPRGHAANGFDPVRQRQEGDGHVPGI